MVKLIKIVKSEKEKKKYKAVFKQDNGREKTTHFGASGMNDYTITGDKEARTRYRKRHDKDLKTNDPTRAGYLSMFILWGDSTSIKTNTSDYRKMFNL